MGQKAQRVRRIQAVRAMFKPLRDARMKREKRLAAAYEKFQADMASDGSRLDVALGLGELI